MNNKPLRLIITLLTPLLFLLQGYSQDVIDWSDDYKLTLEDFQSLQTEIGSHLSSSSIISGDNIELAFNMSSGQFMFTKNFNTYVVATFNRKAAVITAIDSIVVNQLLQFSQFSFDLSELNARKIRKELFEKKKALSNANFYKPVFNKYLEQRNSKVSRILKSTNLGEKTDLLKAEHKMILDSIKLYAEFCQDCKPSKKKKKEK